LENSILAIGQSSQQFVAAKPYSIVAHRGQLFEVKFNNRKYMAAPKFCEIFSAAEIKFSRESRRGR
jgi:hypothetical protein